MLVGNHFVNHKSFQNVYYNVDEDQGRKVYEGDKYQYNYDISHQRADLFAQAEIQLNKFLLTLDGKLAYTAVYRDRHYRQEQYIDGYKGKSKTYIVWDFE